MQYVDERLKDREDLNYKRIFITCTGDVDAKLLENVKKRVRELGPFEEIIHTKAGGTVSNHCGPNCLGLLYYRK